ncbi:MAG: SH3 domain-containing protein [Propionibacteriaceae bacterium]|nr:SH3 domain-containing protein [Propionibacteriaceae bacterium]
MKQWTRPVVAVAASALMAVGLIAAPQASADETLTATTTVNVRSGPSTDRAIIGYVAWGYTIVATGASQDGWTPVDYGGRTGYISSQYLTGATTPPLSDGPAGQTWTTAALNVRNGPSTSHARLDTLPSGAKVTLTGVVSNGFAQIVWYDGQRAWVASSWLDGSGTAPAPGATDPGATDPAAPDQAAPEPESPATDPVVTTPAEPDPAGPAADDPATGGPGDPTTGDQPPAATDPTATDPTAAADPAQPADPAADPAAPTTAAPPPAATDPTAAPATTAAPETAAADPGEPEKPAAPTVIAQKRAGANLNLRAAASLEAAILTVIPSGATLDVTGAESNGRLPVLWRGQLGWVAVQYVTELGQTGPAAADPPAVVGQLYTTDALNVRANPDRAAAIVGLLARGQKVDLTGQTEGSWRQIVYQGAARWVSGDYLSSQAPAAADNRAQGAVDFARSKVGGPYVWGGNGPLGYDCSGLVKAAYASVGVSLPRVADAQAAYGYPVNRADVQVGDLVFYYSPISHVAIYVGDGQVVHASTYGVGIIYSKIDMASITAIRRLV